ncbi:MAG TPA: ribonuclease HI family protein [Actinomycetota bacterium]|nr:ribonuclease HI family protein [Actinomycetota bacterium]
MTALGTPGFALKRGRYLLNTDGGMRRSSDDEPGEAAIGVVLNEPGDRPVTTFKQRIGTETIQGAEYRALIKGLEIAFEHEIGKNRVYVDNQLVVDQINDLAQVNSDHLKPLHRKALALLKQFDDQRVYWVPRERNTDADKLVREALSER